MTDIMDETEAGAALDKTELHEPIPEPDAPLAYSQALELPEVGRRSWMPVVTFAAAALALAGALGGWFWFRPHVAAPAPAPATLSAAHPAPTLKIADPTTPLEPDTAVAQALPKTANTLVAPDPDDVYLAALTSNNIIIKSRADAISVGHRVCELLAQGQSKSAIIADIPTENHFLSTANASAIVAASTIAYCPRYQ